MQFPKIGEKLICNNGTEFTCCNVNDLTPSQTATARDYAQRGVLGDIIGKTKNGGWMHWNSSIEGGDESFNWKIKQIQAQESTLEFRIRVLEKENQILTRLLLKEGKL